MSNGDLGAIFGSAFETSQYEGLPDYEVLPPGKYQVHIDKAELRNTKKGDGRYIWLETTVVNHESLNNRKVWANINIANPNATCVEIGIRVLAALGKAAGVNRIEDTSQLVGAVVVAHVKVKDGQNNVRTFSAVSTSTQPSAPPVQQQPPPTQKPAVWQPPHQQPPMEPQHAPKNQPPQQGSLPWAKTR